ncbi:MAG: ABC-F family ATP-binding cassette domain-containing protein [Candidatus Eisenbacteria bacterium]|nr:ABC-F family ATP-binding cassette domain-containing protein [Candidatus Eisenbacteria bacterium]
MVMLENVSISFAGKSLFRDINWRVGDTDRVGLVGVNGSGKTTLLRLIEGALSPDSGGVTSSKGTTFGYLPQEELTLSGRTLFDELLTVFSDLSDIEDRMRELEHDMSELPGEGSEHDRVMREYAALQHEFEVRDGFTIEARAAEVLAGLGFAEHDRGRLTEEFSGGWQMRIALAKLLLQRPNVLLLDEPTNHLDLESIIWLEEYLNAYPGAVILVSHDRAFLDRVVTRISELGVEGLVDYHGGYASYREQREKRRETMAATRRQQERQIAHLQRFVDRYHADKTKRALVQSRIKMIERIDLVEVPRERRAMHFQFPQPTRAGSVVVALRGVSQAYGDNTIFEDLDLEISRGDRVALVGINGAGKSTLLKIIAGRVPVEAGDVRLGSNVAIQYFGQDPGRELNPERTVLSELDAVAPDDMRPRLRSMLGAFLFSGDDVEKKVGVLSGGEKSRLVFARMLLNPANLLLLDEPTNHLDVMSREVLEEALGRFEGTVCFVSHDRSFMDAIATKVIEVQDGSIRTYLGNYSYYLWKKEQERLEREKPAGPELASPGAEGQSSQNGKRGPKSKEQKRREAADRQRASRAKSTARRDRLRVQDEISSAETRLEEIDIALSDSSIYTDGERVRVLVSEQRELRQRVDDLYERWAELED